jgi:DNA-binding response OmpR family regulator
MMTDKTILIVDGDLGARMMLGETLGSHPNTTICHAATAADAIGQLTARDCRIDAALIEVNLPDEDGRALCQRLRKLGLRIPILLLSTLGEEDDVVEGLDAGANDYVIRPFRSNELRARLCAQLRAHELSEDAVLTVGPYQFRPAQRLLIDTRANRRIRLTEKESAVLKFLHRSGAAPVARRVLLREVWGYCPTASTHTVETHIYRLRRKIEPDATQILLLVNEDGGYRLEKNWQARRAAWQPTLDNRMAIAS